MSAWGIIGGSAEFIERDYRIDILAFAKDRRRDATEPKVHTLPGFRNSEKLLLVSWALQNLPYKCILVICQDRKQSIKWLDELDQYILKSSDQGGSIASLPAVHMWGLERHAANDRLIMNRLRSFSYLNGAREKSLVVTTPDGLCQNSYPSSEYRSISIFLSVGDSIDPQKLCNNLEELGYLQVGQTDEIGSYSWRGGIIDIYSPTEHNPIRVELFGDEIESLRSFDAASQRSMEKIDKFFVAPAREFRLLAAERTDDCQAFYNFLLKQDIKQHDREGLVEALRHGGRFQGAELFSPLFRAKSVPGFEHVPPGPETLVICPDGLTEAIDSFEDKLVQLQAAFDKDQRARRPTIDPDKHFSSLANFKSFLSSTDKVVWDFGLFEGLGSIADAANSYQQSVPQEVVLKLGALKPGQFEIFIELINLVLFDLSGSVVVAVSSEDQSRRLKDLLSHRDIIVADLDKSLAEFDVLPISESCVYVTVSAVSDWLWLSSQSSLVIPEVMIFGRALRKVKKSDSSKLKNLLASFRDLKKGDLVVHLTHGIGRYLGMKTIEVSGGGGDFLVLEYVGNDKIYLPVDRLDILQKYQSGDGKSAAIDRLQGQSWEKRKGKVRKAIRDMADELLKLHAKRKVQGGTAFSPLGDDYYRFESSFPYEETDDQLRAIADVNADLGAIDPMDRLICGDVGFGKTEVAIRATYRVVHEGRQVLVLVPTTILCFQHYRTFKARLEDYGINVGQVNRFVGSKKIKSGLADFHSGKVDVLIGTHRALSDDVMPKHLGLLVVDEEQRFGVAHKEKMKRFKAGCDVLTLSATPIPRTLHMAMIGLRDISIIATPPLDRRHVKTYVSEFDDALVKDAIEQEINRGGQVFFIHNRVEDIVEISNFIKRLVPKARVLIGHGQMAERLLENVMVDFMDQKFDVLVCTTIVESGIDMPNVNTLIVNHAERFGLAQLYQIRGRVGRSQRQAYAYFLTGKSEKIGDEAKRRLEVIITHQELGSGFHIASHDLEIRGAGSLLGGEQSGRVGDVGIELYTEMLESQIMELRGEGAKIEKSEVELKLAFSLVIPRSFVSEESDRLQLYKSIFSSASYEELNECREQIRDRYGALPEDVDNLLKLSEIKLKLRMIGAARLGQMDQDNFEVKFGSLSEAQIAKIVGVAQKKPRSYSLTPDYRLKIRISGSGEDGVNLESRLLNGLLGLLEPLCVIEELQ